MLLYTTKKYYVNVKRKKWRSFNVENSIETLHKHRNLPGFRFFYPSLIIYSHFCELFLRDSWYRKLQKFSNHGSVYIKGTRASISSYRHDHVVNLCSENRKKTLKENVWDIVARGYWMFKNGSITKQRTFNKIRHWKLKERSKGQIIFHINQIKKNT